MHKLDWRPAEKWLPHSFEPVFSLEVASSQTQRMIAGVPGGDSSVLLKLIECLMPPFFVLYVLHTPRGEGEPGRYQSPPLELGALQAFVSRFKSFFAGDARFDLWVHSPSAKGTIVWDRHNLLFGYGSIECFVRSLSSIGFSEGDLSVPEPHMHHYRKKFDPDGMAILSAFSWKYSPLCPEDEQ